MTEIIALIECFKTELPKTKLKQLSLVIYGMLAISGRVTMKGLSRWIGKGGSYKTVERFFHEKLLPWSSLQWIFFKNKLMRSEVEYVLAGDEVVVTKAGKKTHGLDRYFSSLMGKPVKALSFFALSLLDLQKKSSILMQVQQFIKKKASKSEEAEELKKAQKAKKTQKGQKKGTEVKRGRGRPAGSKNKTKAQEPLTDELLHIQGMIKQFLQTVSGVLKIVHIVMDGHFGNKNALRMVQECGLFLISKLKCNAALYEPFSGEYKGRGKRPIYGQKLDYKNLPEKYLKDSKDEKKGIKTKIYQGKFLNKEFHAPLNVVIMVKTNTKTKQSSWVILFSDDLSLDFQKIIDIYSLRFQIEFNFRDAKQFFGLEDFMNTSPTAVTNFANLSFFMVNFVKSFLNEIQKDQPDASILDLKAIYRSHVYFENTKKMLPENQKHFLSAEISSRLAQIGQIHPFNILPTGT